MSDLLSWLPPATLAKRSLVYLSAMGAWWALAEVAAAAGFGRSRVGTLSGILLDPFFSAALGGIFILHALSKRPVRERLAALAAGVGISVALRLPFEGRAWDALLAGLGIGSVLTLVVSAARARGSKCDQVLDVLLPGMVLPCFVFVSGSFLDLTASVRPTTYDLFAYHADQGFGLQPAFVMGRFFASWPPLAAAAALVYHHLPLVFAAVQAASSRSTRRPRPYAISAFLAVPLAGYPLYLLFPVVGPVYVFVGYPWNPPMPGDVPLVPIAVEQIWRNCMPSLHTAWALMAFWLAYPLGLWLRIVTGTFLLFTLLATLGLGYHYLVDLVVALPFTAAIYLALHPATPGGDRLRYLLGGGAVGSLALWLWFVRFGPRFFAGAPAAQAALALATAVGSAASVWCLQRQEARRPPETERP